ncbi:hypothetical protein ACE1ET_09750 [Saccharicrinis sp. FJH62]|uniref:hypothetical protein n=1 Tax=Saccharicrinis sp. FJH62 TaxID=3344657 RepID=UPI0035D3F2E6
MNTNRFCLCITMINFFLSESSNSQDFVEVLKVPWDTVGGIKTEVGYSEVIGLVDFTILNDSSAALLCNVDKKVKIYNLITDTLSYEFNLDEYCDYIEYDETNKLFYLVNGEEAYVFSVDGNYLRTIQYNHNEYLSTGLIINNGQVLMKCNGQRFITLVDKGRVLNIDEQSYTVERGEILNDGTHIIVDGKIPQGEVEFNVFNDKFRKDFKIKTKQHSLGVKVIGIIDSILIFIEYIESFDGTGGFDFKAELNFYSLIDGERIHANILKIYYTSINKEFELFNDNLYNLINAVDGATLLKLS